MRSRRQRFGTIAGAASLGGCASVSGSAASAGQIVLVLTLVVLAAGCGFLLARLHRARSTQGLDQRQRAQQSLSGEVRWAVDRDGLWRDWQAPAGQPRQPEAATLLDTFDAGAGADAVREALREGRAFGPVPVRFGADAAPWLLSAEPTTDLDGRPTGHAGVARQAAAGTDAASLKALLDASSEAVLVVARDGERWTVRQANGAARRHLGDGAGESALPPALAAALDAAPDAAHEHDGWRVAPYRSGAGRGFVLCRAADGGESGDPAAFSYTVSHDLRAPIRVVEGFTRIVKEDYGASLDRIANDHLERVLGATARMNQMIDAMLTLARLSSQPLARQPVNLSQLAGYVVDELRRAAPERVAEIEIEAGLMTTGDPTLLRLVLENLIGNAWKYTARRPLARIVFSRETQNDRTVYVVRDNGAGFDMRSADRLFGLFQRLHSANDFPGTGVGLASVRRIIRRHGGEIWADAEPGRGAAFHFTLGR